MQIRAAILIFCTLVFCIFSSQAGTMKGRVVHVYDGDSLLIQTQNRNRIRVRLIAIDAPEKNQSYAKQSRRALAKLCFQRIATVFAKQTDQYQRVLGRVYCQGQSANRQQLRLGLAWVYPRYRKIRSFQQLERSARARKLGLWRDKNPTPPWIYRRYQ